MSEELLTAVSTAFTTVQSDFMSVVTIALPIGLGIMGVFLAVKYGVKFFKSVSK